MALHVLNILTMTNPADPQWDLPQCVSDFDFTRKDDLPESDIQEFRLIQDTFGRRFAEGLTRYLRKASSLGASIASASRIRHALCC